MPQKKRQRSESELPKGAYRQPDGTIVHRGPTTVMKNGRKIYIVSEQYEHIDTRRFAEALIALVHEQRRQKQDEDQAA